MKIPSQILLTNLIESLNWCGHVELPHNDVEWLAGEILRLLSPPLGQETCELCELQKPNWIPTKRGPVCWDCIEDLHEDMESDREELEDGD